MNIERETCIADVSERLWEGMRNACNQSVDMKYRLSGSFAGKCQDDATQDKLKALVNII